MEAVTKLRKLDHAGAPDARLSSVQPADPRAALGMAVSYLMSDAVFARLPFGQWARVLTGQVNRRHFLFVLEGDRVAGFAGWALTTRERAEAWLTSNRDFGSAEGASGDVALVNVWKAASPAVNRFMIAALRPLLHEQSFVYSRRFYPGGRVRPVRLRVKRR
jgi:hemolysin-activating ACP:hemolysin acyltransferase